MESPRPATPGEKSDKPNDPPVEGGEDEAPPKPSV